MVTVVKGYSTDLNEEKSQKTYVQNSACWAMGDDHVISTTDDLYGSHTEVRTLSRIPRFTRISWQTYSTRCCNTPESLIGAEYTKALKSPHIHRCRGLKSGDRARRLTEPPRPIHCSPKVWFRCCLTLRRKWDGVPSRMKHICYRSWRGTYSKSNWKSFTNTRWHTAPVSLLGKATSP
jgi:hypothetical protein